VNLATTLVEESKTREAIDQLDRAVKIDPLYQPAIELLAKAYRDGHDDAKADALLARY
jgi:Tfp pilus assembly protein PilF